jgi:protein TonB
MTNNEILQSNLLDIIFDKRNKDYGAYALRKDYNQRLLLALTAVAALILTFILLTVFGKEPTAVGPGAQKNQGVVLKQYEITKPKEPEKPKEPLRTKPVEKTATIKHTSNIKITPNELVKTTVPSIDDLKGKQVDNITTDGTPKVDIVKPVEPVKITGENTGEASNNTIIDLFERQPEFPGGQEAMMRFLRNNLVSPGELQAGDKKMVQVRFKIDKEGAVSEIQIIQSAGSAFDREVTRVCRKMPRWTPAIQNGISVPINYILPVTFIGVEE